MSVLLLMLKGTLLCCYAGPDSVCSLFFLGAALEGQVVFEADQG